MQAHTLKSPAKKSMSLKQNCVLVPGWHLGASACQGVPVLKGAQAIMALSLSRAPGGPRSPNYLCAPKPNPRCWPAGCDPTSDHPYCQNYFLQVPNGEKGNTGNQGRPQTALPVPTRRNRTRFAPLNPHAPAVKSTPIPANGSDSQTCVERGSWTHLWKAAAWMP